MWNSHVAKRLSKKRHTINSKSSTCCNGNPVNRPWHRGFIHTMTTMNKDEFLGDTSHIPLGCYQKIDGVHCGVVNHEIEFKYNWFTNRPYLRCKRCNLRFKYVKTVKSAKGK